MDCVREKLKTPFVRTFANTFMLSLHSMPEGVGKHALEEFFEVFWTHILDVVA